MDDEPAFRDDGGVAQAPRLAAPPTTAALLRKLRLDFELENDIFITIPEIVNLALDFDTLWLTIKVQIGFR